MPKNVANQDTFLLCVSISLEIFLSFHRVRKSFLFFNYPLASNLSSHKRRLEMHMTPHHKVQASWIFRITSYFRFNALMSLFYMEYASNASSYVQKKLKRVQLRARRIYLVSDTERLLYYLDYTRISFTTLSVKLIASSNRMYKVVLVLWNSLPATIIDICIVHGCEFELPVKLPEIAK